MESFKSGITAELTPTLKLKKTTGHSHKMLLNLFGYLSLSPVPNRGSAGVQKEAAASPADLGSASA